MRFKRSSPRSLELVQELDYTGYLNDARHRSILPSAGILCQGRGSAANSALCYCLEITAVDPMKHQLLFERFYPENAASHPTSTSI